MSKPIVNKKVELVLVGLDGNAFALLGAFVRQARREKWTDKEIEAVTKEARSGNYSHLVATLMDYCNDPFGNGDEEGEGEEP